MITLYARARSLLRNGFWSDMDFWSSRMWSSDVADGGVVFPALSHVNQVVF